MGVNRQNIANQRKVIRKRGAPAPCFQPDFTEDNELYKQFNGLNEIAVAEEKQQYKDMLAYRLQQYQPLSNPLAGCPDDVIMQNIPSKNESLSDLIARAHYYEHDMLEQSNPKNKND